MRSATRFVVVAVAVLAGSACEEASGPPEAAVQGPQVVTVRDSAEYRCEASGDGPLAYDWSATGGRFAWDSSYLVRWFAPESSGTESVFVAVADSLGRSTADTVEVEVERLVLPFASDWGGLKPRTCAFWGDTVTVGHVLRGSTWSDTGVMFMLVDSANFALWQGGRQYDFRVRRPAYDTRALTDTITRTGYYFAVMDNTGNDEEKAYSLSLTATSR